ncbi:MAG: preprotein translocase subunit YajC [Opitutia bacterium Tous-C4FEB]|jgi:preprotein translocase subunit YajC|nr:preprotein translocase subunit YajC [Verrucomicrobiota bacterium]PAW73591.1 MAG: preprotein translocase subunit YajC [Opitutae bacterium Tous-C5TDCM]PAW90118.1 MAG: preprotein translocase subunit YajC [Opitutae bacterium Tous-C4FEB]
MSPFAALTHFAQATAPSAAPAGPGPMWQMLLFYALIAGGFYFLFIAPQRKKQKAHEKMLSELQSGDEVLTTGGIYGVVTNVKEDRFIVRISDTTKVEIAKGFISSVTKRNGVEEKK